LVNQAADEIEKRISVESLSEAQAQGLIVMLAEIRAKMRLTDLSGEREMNFKTQNYFEFTEGNENQEYGRLRGVFQEGLVKIINSGHNDLYDKFDDYTDLVEAQLRFTSADDRRIRRF